MSNTPKVRFAGFSEDWKKREFKTVFTILQNNTFSRAELVDGSGAALNVHYGDILVKFGEVLDLKTEILPYIESAQIAEKYKSSYLHNGDVIVADTAEDEAAGKCTEMLGLGGVPAISGLHTIPLRPQYEFATGYLGYYLNSDAYHDTLLPLLQGTKVLSISKTALQGTSICSPNDYQEQAQIGDCFRKLDKLIILQQRKCEKLVALKAACLDKMFPKNGSKVPEMRFAGFSGDWEEQKVKDMFTVTRGYVLPATITSTNPTDAMPYPVFSSQTKDNGLMGYYKEFLYENAITWTTDGANAGTVNYRSGKFYCTNVCGVLISDRGYANKFVAEALNLVAFKHVSKVGNPKLMNNVMSEIVISVPATIAEQKELSDFFTQLDNIISLFQRKLDKLKQFKQSMLYNMFT